MKLRLLIVLSFLFIVICPAFSQQPESLGYLKINYDSSGIEIQIDGKTIGFTPLRPVSLTPGIYMISARHPNSYLWGTYGWQDSLQITDGDTLIVQPKFVRVLYIKTDPFDAKIYFENELIGQSPTSISFFPGDSSQLVVKKEGYKDYRIDLNSVRSNYLDLTLSENQRELEPNDLKQIEKHKSKHRYKRLAYSFLGLSILTGLSTVYLKDQADEKYQQYLVAGSLRDMNNYYRDAKRLDNYTYVSMGILQGCFVLSFYFLMKSYSNPP